MNEDHPSAIEDAFDTPQHVDHRTGSRTVTTQGIRRTPEERALALAIYAETGSVQTASRDTGIPATTIDTWVKHDPGIDAELEALRRALREKLAHKFAKAAELSLDALIDRLEHGDYHVDREGNTTRRPMPGRELGFTASLMTDKHALMTGVMGKQSKAEQALTEIARRLVEAGRAAPQRNVIDVEPAAGSTPQDVVLPPSEDGRDA